MVHQNAYKNGYIITFRYDCCRKYNMETDIWNIKYQSI